MKTDFYFLDCMSNPFRSSGCCFDVGAWKYRNEFFTAGTAKYVHISKRLANFVCNSYQNAIASIMSPSVVDALEVIYIQH